MKTIKTQLKYMLFFIILLGSVIASAQDKNSNKMLFVRIYDFEAKKINKGKLFAVNDTLLLLKKGQKLVEVNVRDIGFIKTKRSAGNNVLTGAMIGAGTSSVIGVASINPDDGFIIDTTPNSVGDALAVGVIFGGFTGATIGGITILFKNSKTFLINGDKLKLREFKESVFGSELQ